MLISICIPTYSRLEYLKESVLSCLNQTYTDIEICVSQDPKADGPDREIRQWCMEHVGKIPSFRYNLNPQNLGLAGNWNRCVDMASGKYLIIMGDDDLLAPDFIRSLAEQLADYEGDVAFTNQYFIDEAGVILHEYTEQANATYHRTNLANGRLTDPVAAVLNNSVPMSAALIRRDLLLCYRFDPSLNTPEFEVFLKIAVNGGVFIYQSQKLASYRVHALAATSSGLTIDKLLRNVIEIEVPAKNQGLKYDFVSSKIIPGINMSLRRGDKKLANKLLGSKYYPKQKVHLKLIQKVMLALPNWAIQKIL